MARTSASGSNLLMALLIAALVVAIAVAGWFVFVASRRTPEPAPRLGVQFSLPKAPLPDGPKMLAPAIPTPK